MLLAIGAFGFAAEALLADLPLDAVQLTDALERLSTGLRLNVLGALKPSARMAPALGMGDAGLLGVAHIGTVAIAEQHIVLTGRVPEPLANMNGCSRGKVEKDKIASAAGIAPDRPALFRTGGRS
jgi:hypothetical protein